MNKFILFAESWWVNLLIAIPFVFYFSWRKKGIEISRRTLAYVALFGVAFGFVEASVVVYLRSAAGLSFDIYQQAQALTDLPKNLFMVEVFREIATIVMLFSVAFLAEKSLRARLAIFLWIFAVWDIFYYVGLYFTVGWPQSLLATDVLFLIPAPWFSQVWFPLLVSVLTIIAVIFSKTSDKNFSC